MPVEVEKKTDEQIEEEKRQAIKEIYNDAVRMLELLNILIPQVDTYQPKVPYDLIKELSETCWSLGGNLCVHAESLEGEGKKDDDEEPPEWFGFLGI